MLVVLSSTRESCLCPCSILLLSLPLSPCTCCNVGPSRGCSTTSDVQNAAAPGPYTSCSPSAALPAPEAAYRLVTLNTELSSLITSPSSPLLPLPPPAPWARSELVEASAALLFGASRCALLPSANCQYLSWHPISMIPANDCKRCIHFHFLKGFCWLKASRRVRLGRVVGWQALVVAEQTMHIITKFTSLWGLGSCQHPSPILFQHLVGQSLVDVPSVCLAPHRNWGGWWILLSEWESWPVGDASSSLETLPWPNAMQPGNFPGTELEMPFLSPTYASLPPCLLSSLAL